MSQPPILERGLDSSVLRVSLHPGEAFLEPFVQALGQLARFLESAL